MNVVVPGKPIALRHFTNRMNEVSLPAHTAISVKHRITSCFWLGRLIFQIQKVVSRTLEESCQLHNTRGWNFSFLIHPVRYGGIRHFEIFGKILVRHISARQFRFEVLKQSFSLPFCSF
jgi:hypothetical protein